MSIKNFVKELEWRGMLHDIIPGTEEFLMEGMTSGYVGVDPTAESLHIGHLVSIMILRHFQDCGHRPFLLIGGATGMIGDPSGKSSERILLTAETIAKNVEAIKSQVMRLLDFKSEAPNSAKMVNNYDWMRDMHFIDFIRDVGKHITVNYMMAKDSVKRRINPTEGGEGMSFTEFTYQLIQAYDFYHLRRVNGVHLQIGGSDQWGNMTTGCELIRRKDGAQVYALSCPLITKADGTKFGKSEQGNIWLDKRLTSPYKFYQFWLNVSDEDAERYIKIFTVLDRSTIEQLIEEHRAEPHRRKLQSRLAEEVTCMVHGREEYERALEASSILFGKDTHEALLRLDEDTFLSLFEGVPTASVSKEDLAKGIALIDLLTARVPVYKSKAEFRRAVQGGGLSLNKRRIEDVDKIVNLLDTLKEQYILVQKGKKEYYILQIE